MEAGAETIQELSPPLTHQADDPQQQSVSGRKEEDNKNVIFSRDDIYKSSETQHCEGVSDHLIDKNSRLSQWNEEKALVYAVGSKMVRGKWKMDTTCSTSYGGSLLDESAEQPSEVPNKTLDKGNSYTLHLSIPEQIPVPDNSSTETNASNNVCSSIATVIPRMDLVPFPEAVLRSMNIGTSLGPQIALSNIIDHVCSVIARSQLSSNLGTQIQPSFNWLLHHCIYSPRMVRERSFSARRLGYTNRMRNRRSQLREAQSNSFEEVGTFSEFNLSGQHNMQSLMFMHILDDGSLQGSMSLSIGNSQNGRQDIIILGNSSFLDISDIRDRHQDLRLDVDNMSYEELLDLEDRMGNVGTGLSDKVVSEALKERKYFLFSEENTLKESCSICQEEYVEDDDLGSLNCGHDFHTVCIKQWLRCKNICPICKATGLTPRTPMFSQTHTHC